MADQTDVDDKNLDKSTDSKAADSTAARNEASTGLKDLSESTKDYYQARKAGLRDKQTQELFVIKPEFYDSTKKDPDDGKPDSPAKVAGSADSKPDSSSKAAGTADSTLKLSDDGDKKAAQAVGDAPKADGTGKPREAGDDTEKKASQAVGDAPKVEATGKPHEAGDETEKKVSQGVADAPELDGTGVGKPLELNDDGQNKVAAAAGDLPKPDAAAAAKDAKPDVADAKAPGGQDGDYPAGRPGDAAPKPIDVNAPAREIDPEVRRKIQDDPQVKAADKKLESDMKDLPYDQQNRMRKSMEDFKDRAASMKPPLEAQEVAKTYGEASKLLEAKDNPALPQVKQEDRRMLAQQVLSQAADPTTIDQGKHATCNTAAVEERMYSRNPSAAAEMVRQVATTGEYKTHGDHPHTVKVDPDSLAKHPGPDKNGKPQAEEANDPPKDGKRSYASQVFQVTAVNVGHQVHGYEVTKDGSTVASYPPDTVQYRQGEPNYSANPPDTGERLYNMKTGEVIKDADGKPVDYPALKDDRQVDIYNEISNKKPPDQDVFIANKDFPSGDDKKVVAINNQEDLEKALTDAKRDGKMPVTLKVNSAREPFYHDSSGGQAGGSGGAHVVTVTDYDPVSKKAKIDNTWGKASDHDMDVKDLYKATEGPKDAAKTAEKEVADNAAAGKTDYDKERELLRLKNQAGDLSNEEYTKQTIKTLEKQCADNARDGKTDHISELELLRLKHSSGQLSDAQYDKQLAWQTKQIANDAKEHNGGIVDEPTKRKWIGMVSEVSKDGDDKRIKAFKDQVWQPTIDGMAAGNVKDADLPPKRDQALKNDAESLYEGGNQWVYYTQDDYAKMRHSLENKSPAQLAAMDKEFREKHPDETDGMDGYLKKKLANHPDELQKLQKLLHPETA